MQPHTQKTYTAADFERYHNGSLPADEAHALERAALDDVFLADALDGYAHAKTPAIDVEHLKQELQQRSGKVVLLQNRKLRTFMRIAAMLVLLAGFGWMVYQLSNDTEQNVAVQTEAAPQQKAPSLQQKRVADSTVSGSDGTVATAPTFKQVEKEALIQNEPAANESAGSTDQAKIGNGTVATDTSFSKPHAASVQTARMQEAATAARSDVHVFKARVVDAHNNAVPYATVTNTNNNTVTTADATGLFLLTAPDSNVAVSVNSTGFQLQHTALNRTDSQTTIVLQRNDNAQSEVVVTAQDAKAKPATNIRLEAVEPREGWRRFNAYADQAIKLAKEQNQAAVRGEVVLRFDVDADGNAMNIAVEKPLCASCDSTAVRLIREGGKWKKMNNVFKPKAYIRF